MFWPFNHYPGSDYETFNYDWIIGKLKELKDSVAAALASEQAAAESADEAHGSMVAATAQAARAKTYAEHSADSAHESADSAASIAGVVDQVNTNTDRIDNLIATAGDGTIPSELTDIRVGYNGVVYSTAGTAVRTQVEDLHELIDESPAYELDSVEYSKSARYDYDVFRPRWEQGGMSDTGTDTENTIRVRSEWFKIDRPIFIELNYGYKPYIYWRDGATYHDDKHNEVDPNLRPVSYICGLQDFNPDYEYRIIVMNINTSEDITIDEVEDNVTIRQPKRPDILDTFNRPLFLDPTNGYINNDGKVGSGTAAGNRGTLAVPYYLSEGMTLKARSDGDTVIAYKYNDDFTLAERIVLSDLTAGEFQVDDPGYYYDFQYYNVIPIVTDLKTAFRIEKSTDTVNDAHGYAKVIGKLQKNGKYITDANDTPVELRGIGLHHILQYENLHVRKSLESLKNFGCNLVRISVYLEDYRFSASDNEIAYGYLSHPNETKKEIERIIHNCIDLGLYVLLDWHVFSNQTGIVGTPYTGTDVLHQQEAIEFFQYFTTKYADCPNMLYEIANEPYNLTPAQIASFVSTIRSVIINNVDDPVMVVGAGYTEPNTWYQRCKDLYLAMQSLNITDVFLSPHPYGSSIVSDLAALYAEDIPVFMSEYGNSTASGDGAGNDSETLQNMSYLHTQCIPSAFWKFTDQTMTTSVLRNQGVINSEKWWFGFDWDDLTHNGNLMLGKYYEYVRDEWITRTPLT